MRMLYIKKMFIFINLQHFDVCSQKRKCQRNCNSLQKWKKNTIFELGFHVSFFVYFFIFYFETKSLTIYIETNSLTLFYLYFQCFQEQHDCFILFVFFYCKYFHHTQNILKKMRQKWDSGTKTIHMKMKHERYICCTVSATHQ